MKDKNFRIMKTWILFLLELFSFLYYVLVYSHLKEDYFHEILLLMKLFPYDSIVFNIIKKKINKKWNSISCYYLILLANNSIE